MRPHTSLPALPVFCLGLGFALASITPGCQEDARKPRNPTPTATATIPGSVTLPGTRPLDNAGGPVPGANAADKPAADKVPVEKPPAEAGTANPAGTGRKICTVQGMGSGELNIRSSPGIKQKPIGTLKDGDTFEYVSTDKGWVKGTKEGKSIYVCDTCNGDDNLACGDGAMKLWDGPPVKSIHPNPDGTFG